MRRFVIGTLLCSIPLLLAYLTLCALVEVATFVMVSVQ